MRGRWCRPRQSHQPPQPCHSDRGAALIVALGVFAILFIIALTFFSTSLREGDVAVNTVNSVRAELLTDGAFAVAIAFLNHDRTIHPTYTSLDHAWRTYFNGSWAVGKPWLQAPILVEDPVGVGDVISGQIAPMPLINHEDIHRDSEFGRAIPGVPEINPNIFTDPNIFRNAKGDNIYIPRVEFSNLDENLNLIPTANPVDYALRDFDNNGIIAIEEEEAFQSLLDLNSFVITDERSDIPDDPDVDAHPLAFLNISDDVYPDFSTEAFPLNLFGNTNTLTRAEQVHFWTDIDNDGDGLNDSIWIPVGADTIMDNDGIDNDLDGVIDEPGETALFLYDGTADGIDNNGIGGVDEPDERGLYLTVPIVNNAGVPLLDLDAIQAEAVNRDRRDELDLSPIGIEFVFGQNNRLDKADTIDNNLDLLINGTQTFIARQIEYENGNRFVDINHPGLGYQQIAPEYLDTTVINTDTQAVFSAGEVISEIIGRMAILITDEASKVNINAAGGMSFEVIPPVGDEEFPLTRAMNSGVAPHEYELRVLPGIGPILGNKLWTLRMGGNGGNALSTVEYSGVLKLDDPIFAGTGNFGYDVSLPGYGRVDDNGNVLALALNGIDDDGDGLIDEGINTQSDDPIIQLALLNLLGQDFEGMDEPGEFQQFRPLRNAIAENDRDTTELFDGDFDGVLNNIDDDDSDNDDDGVFDEIGELGDRFYKTSEQVKLVNQIGSGISSDLSNLITAHSVDRNDRHSHKDGETYLDDILRVSSGLKLDYNVARAEEISKAFRDDWPYPRSEPAVRIFDAGQNEFLPVPFEVSGASPNIFSVFDPEPKRFAQGLRREDATVFSSVAKMLGQVPVDLPDDDIDRAIYLQADARLRADQLAVSIKDFADKDHTRSELTARFRDNWEGSTTGAVTYTSAGIESVRINEIMVRPVRRFEAEAITFSPRTADDGFLALNPNRFIPIEKMDTLSTALIGPQNIPNLPDFRMRFKSTTNLAFDGFEISPNEESFEDQDPEGLRHTWEITAPPVAPPGLPLLGLATAWTTYQSYITMRAIDDPAAEFEVPDVVQFSFQGTDGLPPGRYYLTVNTQYLPQPSEQQIDDPFVVQAPLQETVTHENDFRFIFKIGTIDDDILNDIIRIQDGQLVSIDPGAWRTPAVIGETLLGGSLGMAFMHADAIYRGPIDSTQPETGFGFTIEVPEIGNGSSDETQWLHVAIHNTKRDGDMLAINYFDFSQEPDHEYVEIVNLDPENDIDVSGWQLVVEGPDRLIMTIPGNPTDFDGFGQPVNRTILAAGGMLLLGTNKFDDFENPLQAVDFLIQDIFHNGIGLARGSFEGDTAMVNVTVPRTIGGGPSVFTRFDDLDFVDRNGDAAEDEPDPEDPDDVIRDFFVQSTVNPANFFPLANDFNKAWDRIVQLEVPGLVNNEILLDEAEPGEIPLGLMNKYSIGRFVLKGGIFPNRPEYDGIDNDLDNGLLLSDGIDNDGDGVSDETGLGPDGIFGTEDDDLEGIDEGIDEGRFRRLARIGETRPADNFSIPIAVPGSFHDSVVPMGGFTLGNLPDYLDTSNEPPLWKEFIERRNFPGDNVIVTLYEGPAHRDRIVDRITYTQRDVENRAIDDIVFTFDVNLNYTNEVGVEPGEVAIPESLNPNLPSTWPANTMGLDFYRSLERKHPLYSGDRFSTQNRALATDGNYDDWADSTSRWERILGFDADDILTQTGIVDRLGDFDGLTGDALAAAIEVYNGFSHAIEGSPLRMNATQRYTDDQFPLNNLGIDRSWAFKNAVVRNRNIVSPGNLLTMPHFSKTIELFDGFGDTQISGPKFILDLDSPNTALLGTIRRNLSIDSALIGQNFNRADPENLFQDIQAAIGNGGSTSSLTLTVGQATAIPLTPPLSASTRWGQTFSGIPAAWAPILLHGLFNEGTEDLILDTYQHRHLLRIPPTLPESVDIDRWPPERRETLYVSGNIQTFNSTGTHLSSFEFPSGAETLFIWDGEDGLENGEYVLYLVMGEDLKTLLDAHNRSGGLLLTDDDDPEDPILNNGDDDAVDIGLEFVQAALATDPSDMLVDVEVFTDKDGDRTVWTTNGFITIDNLNDGSANGILSESFGLKVALQPDPNRVIRYGLVRIENNYLAIMLRNWAEVGNINQFSRVVLAPRNKTPGRININTVVTRRIDDDGDESDFFNPLVGIPGVMEPEADNAPVTQPDLELATRLNPQGFLAIDLAAQIMRQRKRSHFDPLNGRALTYFEAPDGRYYELTSDLLSDRHARLDNPDAPTTMFPPLAILEPVTIAFDIVANTPVAVRGDAFDESTFRFQRMQNLITTRSDVFEILVTVQAGYGVDANGDGRINYRDDREFIPTAEKRARTVYER